MVTPGSMRSRRPHGFIITDVIVALSILVVALIPLVLSFWREQALARQYYQRAVVLEIVDGQFEVLRRGAWRQFTPGTHALRFQSAAAAALPPGELRLTIGDHRLRLEWVRTDSSRGPLVVRESPLP